MAKVYTIDVEYASQVMRGTISVQAGDVLKACKAAIDMADARQVQFRPEQPTKTPRYIAAITEGVANSATAGKHILVVPRAFSAAYTHMGAAEREAPQLVDMVNELVEWAKEHGFEDQEIWRRASKLAKKASKS